MKYKLYILMVTVLLFNGCKDRDLRGYYSSSPDGKIYLVIDDDNGGACGSITVNKKVWKTALHEPGLISPGPHTIECETEIEFEIKEGTTYHFNYWGP